MRALLDWLALLGLHPDSLFALPREVAVFRAVDRHGRIASRALSDRAVADIIKGRCQAVGHDPERYAGHSLRAGFCTSAAQAGKTINRPCQQREVVPEIRTLLQGVADWLRSLPA